MNLTLRISNDGLVYHIPVVVEIGDKYIFFQSGYNKLLIDELKVMSGAKWMPDERLWRVNNNERNQYALQYLMGERDGRYYVIPSKTSGDVTLGNTSRNLFVHQTQGVEFILQRHHCIIAFEMGLGKTLTCIEAMEEIYRRDRLYIWWLVAPFGAQKEWERQLKRWNALITPVVTTTYESLSKVMDAIDEPPHGVIFDESIKLKNPSAQRSQIANELCKLIRQRDNSYIILLSGAPAPKEPTDWWHQIEVCQPGFIRESNVHKFRNRYADIIYEDGEYGRYPKIVGWKPDEVVRLGRRIAPIVMVKHKKDCFDLPNKIYDLIQCVVSDDTLRYALMIASTAESSLIALEKLRELSDGFQYKTFSDDITYNSSEPDNGEPIPFEGGSKYCWVGSPKMDIIKELLDFYSLENGGPGRLVIYAVFHATIDELYKTVQAEGWCPIKIDGRGWSHPDALDMFDEHLDSQICIIAHPGSVYGLNLSKTHALVYYSNSFTADHRVQSIERRDRPGMDTEKGTRIIDIIHLETDKIILTKINQRLDMQGITMEEIKKCLNQLVSQ